MTRIKKRVSKDALDLCDMSLSHTSIRDTLDFSIKRSTSVGQDTKDQLWIGLGSVTSLEPSFLERTINVAIRISIGDRWSTVNNILKRDYINIGNNHKRRVKNLPSQYQ